VQNSVMDFSTQNNQPKTTNYTNPAESTSPLPLD
jgi:hypothetical protein